MAEIAQYLGTGKRKTSIARVILRPGDGKTWINGRSLEEYFPRSVHQRMVLAPLEVADAAGTYDLRARPRRRPVRPGGRRSARHRTRARGGRPEMRIPLKRQGFLTRDARIVERRRPACTRPARRPSSPSVRPGAVARRYFGTDGVRGRRGRR